MWSRNKYAIQFIFLLSLIMAWIVYDWQKTPKTGFIIIQEVYNGFEMKKEIEIKYNTTKLARDKILDSLDIDLKIFAKKIETGQQKNNAVVEQFQIKREAFFQQKQTYEEDNAALTKQYDQQILTQLNQYIKDFGEKNHFTYIFGNDGNGSLVYAHDAKNITKELTEFINNKYKGL